MKYKVTKTDLFLKGKLIHENSIIEMTEKEAEEFSAFLVPEKPIQQKVVQASETKPKTKRTRSK